MRGHGGKLFAGEGAGDALDPRVYLGKVDAEIAAEDREREPGRAGLVGVDHGGVGMFLDRERMRPAVLDRVAEAVQRAHPRVAAPGKHQLLRTAHADELVIEEVRRHADEREALAALADDLVSGRERDQVGEPLHRDHIAIPNGFLHRLGKRQKARHRTGPPDVAWIAYGWVIYGSRQAGSN